MFFEGIVLSELRQFLVYSNNFNCNMPMLHESVCYMVYVLFILAT